jgi:hypothetical protein
MEQGAKGSFILRYTFYSGLSNSARLEWFCCFEEALFSARRVHYTVEPGYNDIGLYDTSSITSRILWYQLIPHI